MQQMYYQQPNPSPQQNAIIKGINSNGFISNINS